MPYTKPVYASGNPVVDQLFGREFSAWQAEDKGRQADEANQVARAQIAAQARLAEAQQRANIDQQQYANLFRMQELTSRDKAEAARNKIFQQQADTDKAYREGLIKKPDARSQAEVDEINATSEAVAEQYNAALQARLKNATADLEAKRKVDLGTFSWGNKDVNAKYDQLLKDSVDQITQEILDISIKNASGSVGFDPLTKKFRAVRLGGGTATTSTANPADLGTTPVVPTVLPPATDGATVPSYGGPDTMSFVPRGDLSSFSSVPTVPVAPANPAALGVTQPSVRRPYGSDTLLLSAADDAELARQVAAVPPEQRQATARAIIDQLFKSGRARLVTPPTAVPLAPEPNYPRF